MRFVCVFCHIFMIYKVIECSYVKPSVQSQISSDNGDPGEALFLTKYIESDDIETAQQLAKVKHLDISIESYAGYFTVNKPFDSNLFFWFFRAKNNPDDAPILLWLQGAPITSGLEDLFTGNGPFSIGSEQKLIFRKNSWHLNHNLIYIDNPVGTGFSFAGDEDYFKNQVEVGQNLLVALQQFFLLFPNLQRNEFFVSGESYGGKYVPTIGYAIYQDSKRELNDPTKPKINLKGLIIANGFLDPIHQLNYADYLYEVGLIDANGHTAFVKIQNQCIDCINKRDFLCAFEAYDKLILGTQQTSLFKNLTGFHSYYNILKPTNDHDTMHVDFVQKSDIRRAIHVGKNIYHNKGENKILNYLKLDFMTSVADKVAELLDHYPILIVSSQLDIIVAYPLTENYLNHLKFNIADQYKTAERHIWYVDNEIVGYTKQAGNLTEILVLNAGHTILKDQPKLVLDVLQRFTHHKSLMGQSSQSSQCTPSNLTFIILFFVMSQIKRIEPMDIFNRSHEF